MNAQVEKVAHRYNRHVVVSICHGATSEYLCDRDRIVQLAHNAILADIRSLA